MTKIFILIWVIPNYGIALKQEFENQLACEQAVQIIENRVSTKYDYVFCVPKGYDPRNPFNIEHEDGEPQ